YATIVVCEITVEAVFRIESGILYRGQPAERVLINETELSRCSESGEFLSEFVRVLVEVHPVAAGSSLPAVPHLDSVIHERRGGQPGVVVISNAAAEVVALFEQTDRTRSQVLRNESVGRMHAARASANDDDIAIDGGLSAY